MAENYIFGKALDTVPKKYQQSHEDINKFRKRGRITSRAPEAWLLLCAHFLSCLTLSMVLAFVVNSYQAINTSTSRYATGRLLLRVSDITTLISVALVIIKVAITSWSLIAVWRSAYILMHNEKKATSLSTERFAFMIKWRLPPYMMYPLRLPGGKLCWMVTAVLSIVFSQSFISPLLSDAVNWNPSSIPSTETVNVSSTDLTADFGEWYWYLDQQVSRQEYLRRAAGIASLTWATMARIDSNGTDGTGNGCCHIVNDDGLPSNSTLENVKVPCIKINSISWDQSSTDTSQTGIDLITSRDWSGNLSLVGDPPYYYYHDGAAVVFDPSHYQWDTPTSCVYNDTLRAACVPNATLFAGIKTVGMIIDRQATGTPLCSQLNTSTFGDVNHLQEHIFPDSAIGNENCYLIGSINFTAGVTNSKISIYVSSRVVEDQTPIDDVVFMPDLWVQEALWLLPDLMTLVAVMNSSSIPTWNNIEAYVEMLLRYSYLTAWDMFHASLDENGTQYVARP